jgi:hypothetical protein
MLLKFEITWHIIIIQAISKENMYRLNCSTELYVLFEVTFVFFQNIKIKCIYLPLHTIYLITYISIKLVYY